MSGAPAWAVALAQRLEFLAERAGAPDPGATNRLLLSGCDAHGRLLAAFLDACLAAFAGEVARREDLAALRTALPELCRLAREALDGDCDDRAVNRLAAPLRELPAPAGVAASVPGRIVWLAAMATTVPSEEGPATVMLANDLAALDIALPLRALQAALRVDSGEDGRV